MQGFRDLCVDDRTFWFFFLSFFFFPLLLGIIYLFSYVISLMNTPSRITVCPGLSFNPSFTQRRSLCRRHWGETDLRSWIRSSPEVGVILLRILCFFLFSLYDDLLCLLCLFVYGFWDRWGQLYLGWIGISWSTLGESMQFLDDLDLGFFFTFFSNS